MGPLFAFLDFLATPMRFWPEHNALNAKMGYKSAERSQYIIGHKSNSRGVQIFRNLYAAWKIFTQIIQKQAISTGMRY